MHYQFWFSWPAGAGINTIGIFLAKFLIQKGFFCRLDKEYSSVIKGGVNTMLLNISDEETPFLSRKIDLFFFWEKKALEKNEKKYEINQTYSLESLQTPSKNLYTIGMMMKILGFSEEEGLQFVQTFFWEKNDEKNLTSFKEGFTTEENQTFSSFSLLSSEKDSSQAHLFTGNELLAEWGKSWGLEFYSAYPMTPATSVLKTILKYPEITFFQGEDEIAVAMAMLGAKYAGKRAMCATSWGGFALMTESVSFSMQAEIGGVYIISQRDGPSTGTPTFMGQGDLFLALYSAFGETSPIVLAPSNFKECYEMIGDALNYSDQYQHPVIVLVDKLLSEGYCTILQDQLKIPEIKRGKLHQPQETDQYLRYQVTEDGISPYAFPWMEKSLFIATSYEHTESGSTNEDSDIKLQQVQKRRKKMLTFQESEFKNGGSSAFEVLNPDAKKLFITRGSPTETVKQVLKNHQDRGLIVLKMFFPEDPALKTFFETHHFEKLYFIEQNSEGRAEKWLSELIGLRAKEREGKVEHFRKTDLYPVFVEDIEGIC